LRNRYYAPRLGRFTQKDTAMDGTNWYVYCNNSPIVFADPKGRAAWLIHGTWPDFTPEGRWSEDVKTHVEEVFNEKVLYGDWEGKNNDASRMAGADKIYKDIKKYINSDEYSPGEPIRLIGHSHGGNVAILAANMLAEDGIDVETLITVSTPARKEYQLNKDTKVGQHINVWNAGDALQVFGTGFISMKGSGQIYEGADNIMIPTPDNSKNPISMVYPNHAYQNNVGIWKRHIDPVVQRPTRIPGASATSGASVNQNRPFPL